MPTGPSKPVRTPFWWPSTPTQPWPSATPAPTRGDLQGIDYGQWNLVPNSDRPGADPSTTPSAIPSRPSIRPPMPSNTSRRGRGRGPRHLGHQPLPLRPGDHDLHAEQRLPRERLVVELRVLQLDRELFDLQLQLEPQLQHLRTATSTASRSTSVPTTTSSGRSSPTTRCS